MTYEGQSEIVGMPGWYCACGEAIHSGTDMAVSGEALRRRIVLGNRDRDEFIRSLEADSDPNEALVRAAQDFNQRHGN